MSEQPLSDTELAELHAMALLHAPPKEPLTDAPDFILASPEVVAAIDATVGPLHTGGPTLAEYVAAGYAAEDYPPAGYAAVSEETAHAEIAAEDVKNMGPSGAANIRAFLEAKQAEADAKAAAG